MTGLQFYILLQVFPASSSSIVVSRYTIHIIVRQHRPHNIDTYKINTWAELAILGVRQTLHFHSTISALIAVIPSFSIILSFWKTHHNCTRSAHELSWQVAWRSISTLQSLQFALNMNNSYDHDYVGNNRAISERENGVFWPICGPMSIALQK